MLFSDRLQRRVSKGKDPLPTLKSWIADTSSRSPAMSKEFLYWFPVVSRSRDALAAIFLSFYLPPWETDEIWKRIEFLCYTQRYSGEWSSVQDFLERADNPEKFLEMYSEKYGDDSLFGNFARYLDFFLRKNRKCYRTWKQRGPVNYPQRHRGYRDKGTYVPISEKRRRSAFRELNPGEDRRYRCCHPLLREDEKYLNSPEGVDESLFRLQEKEVLI